MVDSKISIIIPSYNSERWLSQTLNSCLTQKIYISEIIVIDDHSNDASLAKANNFQKNYPEIIKVYSNLEKGSNNARNYGFSLSKGNFIQWLDADDFLLPNKFANQLEFFNQNPTIDIVYSDWYLDTYQNDKFERRELHKNKPYPDYLFELLKDRNWSPPMNYLLKRSIAERLHTIQAWNPKTQVGQDREYFTLAALNNANFAYCEGFYSVYNRWSKNSISQSNQDKWAINYYIQMNKFKSIIAQQNRKNKIKYFQIINSNIIKSIIQNPSLKLTKDITLFSIKWNQISGKRTKIRSIFLLIKPFFKNHNHI